MGNKRIFLGFVAVVAIVLFVLSLVLPIAIGVGNDVAVAISLWTDLKLFSTIACLVFTVLAIAPVLRPSGKSWTLPLAGALLILGAASFMLVEIFRGNSAGVLLTICIFAVAGLLLLIEACVVCNMVSRVP